MISVVIPLYNKEKSIANTINSVLNQTFKDFELIIVNDGSTDKSRSVVESIDDNRIKIIDKKNGGVSSARNLGIKQAKYDWIAFLDADDKWLNNHILNAINVIKQNPDVSMIGSGFCLANNTGEILREYYIEYDGLYDYFEVNLIKGFVVNSSSIFFNKRISDNIFFDENLSKGEDTKFWDELGKKSKIYLISDITSFYIDDSENKAIYSYHDLNRTYVYNLDLNDISNDFQIKYYKRLISYSIFLVLRNQQRPIDALKIYLKYYKFLRINGLFEFALHVVKKKLL